MRTILASLRYRLRPTINSLVVRLMLDEIDSPSKKQVQFRNSGAEADKKLEVFLRGI
ncbi:MAG: hypothetical protein ABI614_12710 [Planctomycetota bacterium]